MSKKQNQELIKKLEEIKKKVKGEEVEPLVDDAIQLAAAPPDDDDGGDPPD